MNDWLQRLAQLSRNGTRCMLVSVERSAGSAPREAGARMIVTDADSFGSIGGGNLEYQAIGLARRRFADADAEPAAFVQRFPLGPTLGQCCGGVVDVSFVPVAAGCPAWLEELERCRDGQRPAVVSIPVSEAEPVVLRLDPDGEMQIALFGAGHVGKAIVPVLASALPCRIRWVDDRAEQFPAAVPGNVETRSKAMPLDEVALLPGGSCVLVMTHSHALDQAICSAVLSRDDFSFLGLIGSETKRRRFLKRLRDLGHSEAQLQRLTCPIGIPGIRSKRPEAIAIAVAAQVLQLHARSVECGAGFSRPVDNGGLKPALQLVEALVGSGSAGLQLGRRR